MTEEESFQLISHIRNRLAEAGMGHFDAHAMSMLLETDIEPMRTQIFLRKYLNCLADILKRNSIHGYKKAMVNIQTALEAEIDGVEITVSESDFPFSSIGQVSLGDVLPDYSDLVAMLIKLMEEME